MKKIYLTLALAFIVSATYAQKLPVSVTIKLTDKQVLKLDSAIQIVSKSIDSKSLTNYFLEAISPIFNQVREQLIADKPKEVPTVEPRKQ